jgi:hypothetical protein
MQVCQRLFHMEFWNFGFLALSALLVADDVLAILAFRRLNKRIERLEEELERRDEDLMELVPDENRKPKKLLHG